MVLYALMSCKYKKPLGVVLLGHFCCGLGIAERNEPSLGAHFAPSCAQCSAGPAAGPPGGAALRPLRGPSTAPVWPRHGPAPVVSRPLRGPATAPVWLFHGPAAVMARPYSGHVTAPLRSCHGPAPAPPRPRTGHAMAPSAPAPAPPRLRRRVSAQGPGRSAPIRSLVR